jgi:uncharacterized phage-associated protein
MQLSSLDYMRLISWLAYFRNGVVLNKTQLQKILYICYGCHLASDDTTIFADDTPKAWPFGPVFPITYRRYHEDYPTPLTEAEKTRFRTLGDWLRRVDEIVARFCHYSSSRLSLWSHESGGPWALTVYAPEGVQWNREISLDKIKTYFSGQWDKNL